MNKFKKIAIEALLAAGAGCLAAAAGCSSGPDYYKLAFEGKGLDYVFQGALAPESGEQFVNGYVVKSGVEVRFTLALSSSAVGTPVILLNGEELKPDEEGVYSFVMDKDSTVTATGLQETKTVTFSVGDYYKFYDEKGDVIEEPITAVKGDSIKFKVWVSPYMKDKFTVTNDTEELEPDANGFYTITDIIDDSTVNVGGLEQADSFLERKEGTGTAEDPFIIREPIDLFTVAGLVNSDWYTEYSMSHFKMEADIDMKGEKLFVIGDMSNVNAVFCGGFDGNGHKISNFYITDEAIEQSSFQKAYLPFVGLFGYVGATQTSPVVIKDLTLENYEVTIHPELSSSSEASYAGSLVAYGIGVQIEGCKAVNGKVLSYNDNKKMSYIGGLVGVLQSAYSDTTADVITYDAYVNGCSADVQVTGRGAIRCAGGIVGILSTADTQAIAYVSNSVTTGTVSKAMFAGGIAGNLGRFSSVANCYSSCAVSAENGVIGAGMDPLFRSAFAGGIVGYAENDGAITGCYSANTSVKATSQSNLSSTGAICGKAAEAFSDASDSAECVLYKNLDKTAGGNASVFLSQLGWNPDEWNLTGEVPVYTGAKVAHAVKISVRCGSTVIGEPYYEKQISIPQPIYAWYNDGMSEYVEDGDMRSWGYYFDNELTQKVPYGYLPVSDCTLYVGMADYSQVAGTYHIGASTYGMNATIQLDGQGGYFFRDGGMSFKGSYSYDGEKVTLYNSCLGALEFASEEINGSYITMVMQEAQNGYSLNGKVYVTDANGNYTLQTLTLTAIKEQQGFTYGEYVNERGALLLRPNGTGTYTVGNTSEQFTFTYTQDGIKLSNNMPVTVVGGKVTAFNGQTASLKDGFAGVWKTNAGSAMEYSFDGLGVVKFGEVAGTYEEVSEGRAVITLNGVESEAIIGSDSALYIDGIAYYLSDGFTGSWYGRSSVEDEKIELKLGGVGKNGYGEAEITFSAGVTHSVNGQYSVTDDGVMVVYVGDMLYGELRINMSTGVAYGPFFNYSQYSLKHTIVYATAEFKIYDLFKGVWECDAEGISSINFTGKTAGNQAATALVTDNSGNQTPVDYTLTSATSGTITIGDKTYVMTFDEKANRVSLAVDQAAAGSLAQRDAWYGVTLYEGEISYRFNGKGNLKGTVTLSSGSTLDYIIGENGLPVINGAPLVITQNGFEWGSKTLVFNTGFAKTWLMPVTNQEITIGEVTAELNAQVTIGGNTYTYDYNPERNTLTYTSVDGRGTATQTVLSLSGGKELSYTVMDGKSDTLICIEAGALDSWQGTYTAADGSTWTFDGHGLGYYGRGTAIHTDAKGKKTTYDYLQNKLDQVYIFTAPNSGMVFTEVALGGYKKQGENKGYDTVVADIMYLVEARLNGEYVTYDGAGKIWNNLNAEVAYTYKPLTEQRSVITDAQDVKHFGVLTPMGGTSLLALVDYTEWTDASNSTVRYIFDDDINSGWLWRVDGDEYTREYYYKVGADSNNVYYLTDTEENKFIMTLDKTNKTFKLEENKDDE